MSTSWCGPQRPRRAGSERPVALAKRVELRAGEYTYIGSALSRKGATSLARRLVRHTTRSGDKTPHPIRSNMICHFTDIGLGAGDLLPRSPKRMHWNVDHLLDLPEVDLCGVYVLRTDRKLEASLGKFLESDPHTIVFEKGLGANDVPDNTHILRVEAPERWWRELEQRLKAQFFM